MDLQGCHVSGLRGHLVCHEASWFVVADVSCEAWGSLVAGDFCSPGVEEHDGVVVIDDVNFLADVFLPEFEAGAHDGCFAVEVGGATDAASW